MIKVLSPYYINIPWIAPSSSEVAEAVTVKLYVWEGEKGAVPTEATYEVYKENATGSSLNIDLNIANWIADFISITPQSTDTTEIIDGGNQYWVKWETYYTTTDENDLIIPTNQTTKLFTRGYSYGMDGKNVEVSEGFLIPISDYKVSTNGVFCIPFLIGETENPTPEINITNVVYTSGTSYDVTFNWVGAYSNFILNIALVGGGEEFRIQQGSSTITLSEGNELESIYISAYETISGTTVISNTFTI